MGLYLIPYEDCEKYVYKVKRGRIYKNKIKKNETYATKINSTTALYKNSFLTITDHSQIIHTHISDQ